MAVSRIKKKANPLEKWQTEAVHKENIEPGSSLDGVLDYKFLDQTGDDTTDKKGKYGSPGSGCISFVIIYHHDGRNGQQV